MSFLNTTVRVGAEGPLSARIALVGEAPSHEEVRSGRPFVGTAGGVLNDCLMLADIPRASLYITNLFKEKVQKQRSGDTIKLNDRTVFDGKNLLGEGIDYQRELVAELSVLKNVRVVVALGKSAVVALLGMSAISKIRGYPYVIGGESHRPTKHAIANYLPLLAKAVVLPTFHPANTLYGNYLHRYLIIKDLERAKTIADKPSFHYDPHECRLLDSFEKASNTLHSIYVGSETVAVDIEVIGKDIACVGLAVTHEVGYVLPFYWADRHYWSLDEEAQLWNLLGRILKKRGMVKVLQNSPFDTEYLWSHNRLYVSPPIEDTMVRFGVEFAEFSKNLGMLGSIYTWRPYWKDLMKMKQEKGDA